MSGGQVGYATLSIIPSAKGFGTKLSNSVTPETTKAGGVIGKILGSKIAKVAGAAIATGLLAGGALVGIGQQFEQATNAIIVGTGASGDALKDLQASVKNVGKTTPSSFGEIGTAIADVNTRLGLTGPPLEDLSGKFLNLSRITGSDLSTNIANVSRVFGDWGVQAKDQPKALDAIFEATKRTGIGLDQLTNNVVQFGAPLRQFGFGFEESLALFGKWEKEGVNTQVVLAGLKQGLGRFSDAGKDPEKELNRVTKAVMAAGSAGEANKIAIEAFGVRAGPDMAAAIREGRFELGDMVEGLKNSEGALDDADKRTRTFSESWQILSNKVLTRVEPIASRVVESLNTGMDWLANNGIPTLERFGDWLQRNATAIKVVALAVTAFLVPSLIQWGVQSTVAAAKSVAAWFSARLAAIKSMAAQVAAVARVVAGWVVMGAQAVAGAARVVAGWAVSAAGAVAGAAAQGLAVARVVAGWVLMGVQSMLQAVRMAAAWFIALGPIGWAIAAVIAVAALVIANWDKIKAWTIKAWTAVVGKVTAAWEAIKGWVKSGVTFVVNLVKAYFNLYVTIIKGALNTALAVVKWVWNAIVQGFTFYVNLGKRIVQNGINAVLAAVNWLKELPGKVAGFFQSMISRVNSKISSLVSFVRRIPSRILSALGSLGTLLKESGRRIIQGLIDGIREKVGAVKDAVTGVLQKARDLLPFSPAKEGPFSGRGWTLYSGRSIGDSLAKGMASQAGSVRAAARALALEAHDPLVSSPAMPGVGALASSSTNGVPEHVTVEIGVKDLEGIRTVEDFLKMIATRTRMNSGVRAVAGG